jgi:peptidoglycan/xylan/chitin deacetylase (PgdA/CDA1 family)
MAATLKQTLLKILSFFLPGLGKKGAILMYHSVDKNGLFFTTTPEEFERQMQYIKQKKYTVLPLSEMCLRIKEGKTIAGCVCITFDDGYADFFKNAFPVLKRYGFPATVFLISGKLGEELSPTQSKVALKMMTDGEVKRAATANSLIEFMPHTKTHPDLSKIPFEEAVKEINQSRKDVELLTGKPADVFAYPKGRYSIQIADYLRKGDLWLGAVTVETGLVQNDDDLFTLKRIPVDSATTFPIFKRKLSRGIDLYQTFKSKK